MHDNRLGPASFATSGSAVLWPRSAPPVFRRDLHQGPYWADSPHWKTAEGGGRGSAAIAYDPGGKRLLRVPSPHPVQPATGGPHLQLVETLAF